MPQNEKIILTMPEQLPLLPEYIRNRNYPVFYKYGEDFVDVFNFEQVIDFQRRHSSGKDYLPRKIANAIICAQEQAGGLVRRSHFPSILQIEHTSLCNARCIMCSHFYLYNKDAASMTPELFQRIEHLLPTAFRVVMHGNGEPFLLPEIGEYLRIYHRYDIKVVTNTNLSVLPDSVLDIANDVFCGINISCDGADRETFESIRKGLKFGHFQENLKILRNATPGVPLTLAVVIMRQNVEMLTNMVHFAAQHDLNRITFSELGVNPFIGNEQSSPSHFPILTAMKLHEAARAAQEYGIEIVIPTRFLDIKVLPEKAEEERAFINYHPRWYTRQEEYNIVQNAASLDNEGRLLQKRINLSDTLLSNVYASHICPWLDHQCFIDTKGNIVTCCYQVKKTMGNLFEDKSFVDIWNSEGYVALRQAFQKQRVPRLCSTCHLWRT